MDALMDLQSTGIVESQQGGSEQAAANVTVAGAVKKVRLESGVA